MGAKTGIEWTGSTWTPLRARNLATGKVGWHCEHMTTGCINCYAETINKPYGTGLPFKPGHRTDIEIFIDEEMLLAPLRWKKPRMVFVCSMTDLFAEFVKVEWIDRLFAVMALAPQHTFQVLTKRADRMRDYLKLIDNEPVRDTVRRIVAAWPGNAPIPAEITFPLPNVWIGVSAERQQEADERIAFLLDTPATVKFVSCEPLLGPIDLQAIDAAMLDASGMTLNALTGGCDSKTPWHLNWVIVGGESGPNRRPTDPDWMRAIRDQCASAGVAYFTKQMTGKKAIPPDLMIRQFPETGPVALSEPEPALL